MTKITLDVLARMTAGGFEEMRESFKKVDKRFEQVDKRFEQVDKRFEQVDGQFLNINARLDILEMDMKTVKQEVLALRKSFNKMVTYDEFKELENRLTLVEKKLKIKYSV